MKKDNFFEIEPIQRQDLVNMVANKILDSIKEGKLSPRDKLPSEHNLANMFGVSRPVIREAIKALNLMGTITVTHGSGIFVSDLSADDLLQPLTFFLTLKEVSVEKLYQARQLIEGEISALAAIKATDEHIKKLENLIEKQKAALQNAELYREVDFLFHVLLAEIADNPFLLKVTESFFILGLEWRKIASETESVLAGSVKQHKAIVAAMKARNSKAARKAMSDHMAFVLRTTKKSMLEKKNRIE